MSRSSGTTRRRRRHGQPAACEAKRYAICGIENHGFRGVTNGNKKLASNAKRYPLCENKRIPFTRSPPVSCLLGRCPNPRRTQNCVLKRRINPSATRFCKSLYMRQFPSHRLLTPADKAAVDAFLFSLNLID